MTPVDRRILLVTGLADTNSCASCWDPTRRRVPAATG